MIRSSVPVVRAGSVIALLLLAGIAAAADAPEARGSKLWVYIGTYTGPKSKGIYRAELDVASAKLGPAQLVAETTNPSYLAIHPSHRFLYAVNETGEYKGTKSGSITAYAIDPKTGDLTKLNEHSSLGASPCYITVDKKGKHVLVANYTGGNAVVVPLARDGRLSPAAHSVGHKGAGSNPARQEAPHAHSINLDAANRFAFLCDLGLDRVFIYKYNTEKGMLTKNDPADVELAPGAGPRHFAFHPSEKYAYVINELKSTITALSYDADTGALKPLQSISTLPKDFKGNTTTADVRVHPSGKFVYGSNRGENSIAIFKVDQETGKLTAAGRQGKGVKIPRNFGIDPSGKLMLVANQEGHDVIVFRINQETGALTPVGEPVEVGAPVCVQMMPAGK